MEEPNTNSYRAMIKELNKNGIIARAHFRADYALRGPGVENKVNTRQTFAFRYLRVVDNGLQECVREWGSSTIDGRRYNCLPPCSLSIMALKSPHMMTECPFAVALDTH
jgi:hypothetical protein